jgi:hypothetical protein
MPHTIDAEGVRSWVDDDDGNLYASDGDKRFYVHLRLYGDPRFVVKKKKTLRFMTATTSQTPCRRTTTTEAALPVRRANGEPRSISLL